MIVCEALTLEDGRCIVRAVQRQQYIERRHIGEWVFRLPPIEYTPKRGDNIEFSSLVGDYHVHLKGGPPISISVNDYYVLSGTCVGMPLDHVFADISFPLPSPVACSVCGIVPRIANWCGDIPYCADHVPTLPPFGV